MAKKALTSVLIKPAGPDCNMACAYCFYLNKSNLYPQTLTHRMSNAVLEETVHQILSQGERFVSFAWQGGEPTLMGLDFFRKAIEFQKKYGFNQTIGNGLQTNGILLDKEWAAFLRRNRFLVGLSLDGPEHIHNKYRLLQGGQSSWYHVVDKAKLLLDSGIAVNVLSVVSAYSVQFPEEIYTFNKDLGLNYMQFIPVLEPDPLNPEMKASYCPSPEAYGQFLIKIFNLWLRDFSDGRPKTSIRFFDSVFYTYVGLEPPDCTLLPECGVYIVVEHNGDVYPCDFFVEPHLKLGNINENKLIDMLNSEVQNAFGARKSFLVENCTNCHWLQICRGGCPKDRKFNPVNDKLNYFCKAYRMFFEYADRQFKRIADRWQKEQADALRR